MINLIIYGVEPNRVLIGDDFPPCQEGRAQVTDGIESDASRFPKIIADSDYSQNPPVNPTYSIVPFEVTTDALRANLETELADIDRQLSELDFKSIRSVRALLLDPSLNSDRTILEDYEAQINTLRTARTNKQAEIDAL